MGNLLKHVHVFKSLGVIVAMLALSACNLLQRNKMTLDDRLLNEAATAAPHATGPAKYGNSYAVGNSQSSQADISKPEPSTVMNNLTRDLGIIAADRISCPVATNGLRLKSSTTQWHILNAMTAYNNALRSMKKDSLLDNSSIELNKELLKRSFLLRFGARLGWRLDETATLAHKFADDFVNLASKVAEGVKNDESKEHVDATAFINNTAYREELLNLSTSLNSVNDAYRGSVAKEDLCSSFLALDIERWRLPQFDDKGNGIWVPRQVAIDMSNPKARVKTKGEDKLPTVTEDDIASEHEYKVDPHFFSEEAEKKDKERRAASPLIEGQGVAPSETPYPFKRELESAKRTPSFFGVKKEDMKRGIMPGIDSFRELSHYGPFNPQYKKVIATHMTAGSSCAPTAAHFTICRDGTVMQHIPVTHQARAAIKGNNPWTINIEFVAAYTSDAAGLKPTSSDKYRDLSAEEGGGKGHHYQIMTPEQIEAGAKVYAFIAQQQKIPLTRLTDGKNTWKGGGKQVTGYYAGRREPAASGVANHRELNPYKKGIAAWHSDFMREKQHQEMLSRARQILIMANSQNLVVALKGK